MRGDINAVELYQDREFLVRVGLGIYDVEVGSTGGVGFEDVHKYAYLKDEGEDPKLYRRRVFSLVGQYYPNDLAHALWDKFEQYQAALAQQYGKQPDLAQVARQWLEQYGHDFLKDWTLRREEVPFRMRNQAEPRLGLVDVAACRLAPQWRELLEVGFSLPAIAFAALFERRGQHEGDRYIRLTARLSGQRVKDSAELEKRRQEVAQLEAHLSQQTGASIGLRAATVEYYRRLSLLGAIEGNEGSYVQGEALMVTC